MGENIKIRVLSPEDMPKLSNLTEQFYEDLIQLGIAECSKKTFLEEIQANILEALNADESAVLGAFYDDILLGVIVGTQVAPDMWSSNEPSGMISWLCVDPRVRKLKVGTALVKALESLFFSCGIREIVAICDHRNLPSKLGLEKLGYRLAMLKYKKEI